MIEYLDYCQTDAQREAIKALHECGSQRKAAKALGVSKNAVTQRLDAVKAHAAKRGYSPEHGLNRPQPDGYALKGSSALVDERSGETVLQWYKTDRDKERQVELVREMVEEMSQSIPPRKKIKPPTKCVDNLMTVYPMGDPHFGLYCWAAEVGNDFDLKIARQDLCNAVRYLVQQSPPSRRGVLVNLGDFFHADNFEGTTAASGHILDMDSRMPKMVNEGVLALKTCLDEMLRKHEIVEIVNAPGNHDPILGHVLSIMFGHWLANDDRVVVHDKPTWRHYIEHGKVLLGITHGDKTKDAALMGIMATEQPEAWGRTKHRVYMRGHHHHDSRQEYNGGVVEQFRTLAAGDAYAVGHGYLSGRDMKCIVYDREYGEVARWTCGIDILRGS